MNGSSAGLESADARGAIATAERGRGSPHSGKSDAPQPEEGCECEWCKALAAHLREADGEEAREGQRSGQALHVEASGDAEEVSTDGIIVDESDDA